MTEVDSVARVSDRICGHMNADHADAVEHLVMYHAKLPRLPRWSKMESIAGTHMILRYTPPDHQGAIMDENVLPLIRIPFDPPLESTHDARKRLVALSKMCQEENERFARQNLPQDFWDKYNMEVLIERVNRFCMDPITIITLLTLLGMAWHPERMTSNEILQATLPIFRTPFLVILAFIGLIAVWHGITVLSRVWTNAEPLPMNQKSIPSWIFKTLTKPTLPRLDEEGWQKQTVLISGGARGLGAMLAIRLAERGAKVITLDVGKTTVKHPNLSAYHCDISKQINVASVARNIIYRHGSPTMLINNAGIRHGFPLLDLTTSAISKTLETNTLAHFWLLKEFLPSMVSRKQGHIVTISSIMGHAGVAQMTDYVASKHAVVGLHESLRFELDAIYGTPHVRTTLVTTGHLQETDMFTGIKYNRFARFMAPAVQASTVIDKIVDALERQESRYIMLPWYAIWTPLLRLLPSFVHDFIQLVLGANYSMSTMSPSVRASSMPDDVELSTLPPAMPQEQDTVAH